MVLLQNIFLLVIKYLFSAESLSIEETNKLRKQLGLAPLELDNNKPEEQASDSGGGGEDNEPPPALGDDEELFTEDGVSIVHKRPKNWSELKEESQLKEKLEAMRQKRAIESKLLKVKKGLADSDSEEEEEDASSWLKRIGKPATANHE